MVKIWLRSFLVSVCLVCLVGQALAQTPPPAADDTSSSSTQGPRKQMATIIFAGLGGAILGLSTLSFYGRPQDHLANIAIGFAFGAIGGTIYVTYQAATRPQEVFGQSRLERELILPQQGRAGAPLLAYHWSF